MKTYRCYLLDRSLRIVAFEDILCANDQTAILAADKLLKLRQYLGADLWERERYVAQLRREVAVAG